MKKKTVLTHYKKEWQAMEAQLESYFKTRDQEDLHRFRVQVKKTQALLRLCGRHSHRPFRPVKKIFKQAGILRDAFISGTPEGKLARDFRRHTGTSLKRIRKAGRALEKTLRPVDPKTLRQFYKSELRWIAANLATPSPALLHDCRKRIKVLLYNYPLVREELRFALNTTYLDQLQEAIGKWHDRWLGGKDAWGAGGLGRDFYHHAFSRADQGQVLA